METADPTLLTRSVVGPELCTIAQHRNLDCRAPISNAMVDASGTALLWLCLYLGGKPIWREGGEELSQTVFLLRVFPGFFGPFPRVSASQNTISRIRVKCEMRHAAGGESCLLFGMKDRAAEEACERFVATQPRS